ncbi:DUF982 domain-containing protein [Chelativorans sp. AA-79]|uniref:DUF982 domain-containing protein n=1 Tax=Chelativorans sp. AA-79 TaxID=3028735 RepID=UPI0023F876B5|nr:DUF982 domain-containing protein [Chelativorans sp. AA-79]WEX10315.1 DUF982 domain-containing protein [Chelativorans sp. AA-79]
MVVYAGPAGGTRIPVRDTVRAAKVLAKEWPKRAERGAKYFAACRACLAVAEKGADPERARKAFVAAAEEAGMLE